MRLILLKPSQISSPQLGLRIFQFWHEFHFWTSTCIFEILIREVPKENNDQHPIVPLKSRTVSILSRLKQGVNCFLAIVGPVIVGENYPFEMKCRQ